MSALRLLIRANGRCGGRGLQRSPWGTSQTWQHHRAASTFNIKDHVPDDRFAPSKIGALLKKSILNDVPEAEAKTRIELAACYRLFAMEHLNENIYNHLSAKIIEPDGSESFLLNPFGLCYEEITASSLVKVDLDGKIKNPGVVGDIFGINEAGFVIHSCIHRARPELRSVMHTHFPAVAGVSCVKEGFLELAQTSHQSGPVSYHDYNGLVVDMNEQKSLVSDIGDKNIMFLRNHGVLTCGESPAAAWYTMYQLVAACQIQVAASACALGDPKNLVLPAKKLVDKTFTLTAKKHFSGAAYGAKELSAYMRRIDQLPGQSYRT